MLICDFIIECAQIEKSIEKSRQFLCSIPQFHPYTAFKMLDSGMKCAINAQNVQIFLHKYGMLHSLNECSILFYKNELNYTEFLRMILPSDLLLRDYISTSEPKKEFSTEVAYALAKHLDLEINQMFTMRVPENIEDLKSGTKEGIQDYFQHQLTFIYSDEIDAAIRRLDFYGDGEWDLRLINNWAKLFKSEQASTLNSSNKKQQFQIQNQINVPASPLKKKKIEQKSLSTYQTPKKQSNVKQNLTEFKQKSANAERTTEKKGNNQTKLGMFSTEKKQQNDKLKQKLDVPQRNIKSQLFKEGKMKVKKNSPAEIFEYLIDREIRIEKMKQQLSMQKDFNAFDAFKGIDKNYRGYITYEDFDKFLQQISGTSKQLFEKYEGQVMKFSDFIHLIQPQVQEYAEIMHNRLPKSESINISINDIFSQHTLKLMIDLLKMLQDTPVKLNGNRQLFNEIDVLTRDNHLGVSDIQQYLYENNIRYTHPDVLLLLLKYDKDKDGRLSYQEFTEL